MSQLFINTNIYNCEKDYIIGGFFTDQESFSPDKLELKIENRVAKLLADFIASEQKGYKERLKDGDKIDKHHGNKIAVTKIEEFLKMDVSCISVDDLVEVIMESDQMNNWLTKIKIRIKSYFDQSITVTEISTNENKDNLDIEEAKYQMEEANFITLLEELAMVYNN